MRKLALIITLLINLCIGADDIDNWRVQPIATEQVLYTAADPENVFVATPGIVVCPAGRIVATVQVSGKGVENIPEVKKGGRTYIYTSDDHGETWKYQRNVDLMHGRPFVAGDKLVIMGHMGDLRVTVSEDWGNSWSEMSELTEGRRWHASATGILHDNGYVYIALEDRIYNDTKAWYGAELAPILLRGKIASDLTKKENWTIWPAPAFKDVINDRELETHFGLPFHPSFYPDRYFYPDAGRRNASPMGWLETNVVKIYDPHHYFHDPEGKTFHLVMRASTGLTNIACIAKCVVKSDGALATELEKAPSGKKLLFTQMPGGHMRFHILYDKPSGLYWLLNTQSTDSMTRPQYLSADRFGGPDNERHRLQLHFSKNLFDWCFAGLVAVGPSEKEARHYASMDIDGDDLVILSRSANKDAESAHNGNIITFHKIKNFRRLIY